MKRKRRKAVRSKLLPKPEQIPTQQEIKAIGSVKKGSAWLKFGRVLAVIVAVIGVGASFIAYFGILPKMQFQPGVVLNPKYPFSTQFEISNDGYLDASKVRILCGINNAVLKKGNTTFTLGKFSIGNTSLWLDRLRGGEKATFPLDKATYWFYGIDTSAGAADIELYVEYKIKIFPFTPMFQAKQRFITVTNFNGDIEWDPAPSIPN